VTADYTAGFGDFEGRIWLDTAHQGALPLRAHDAVVEASRWKRAPHHMTFERFQAVPERLRWVIGRLLDVPPSEIVLSNSASYGLHVLAQAMPWSRDDEILVVEGDFPSNILPWLELESTHGVRVRRLRAARHVLEPDELRSALTPKTRVLCVSWVHSFSGHTTDLGELGRVCGEHGVISVVNASQGLGSQPLSPRTLGLDCVVSIGSKWLCGPYGTGVFWLHPRLLGRLHRTKRYWLAEQDPHALESPTSPSQVDPPLAAASFDIFGTANPFTFLPFAVALEHLLQIGLDAVHRHNQSLVGQLIAELPSGYDLLSPQAPPRRSSLVLVSHAQPSRNAEIVSGMRKEGVDVSLRRGAIRLSPHLYNTPGHIARVTRMLAELGGARKA